VPLAYYGSKLRQSSGNPQPGYKIYYQKYGILGETTMLLKSSRGIAMDIWLVIVLVIVILSFISFLVAWALVASNRDEDEVERFDESDQIFVSKPWRK
jgi:hypothetical protein